MKRTVGRWTAIQGKLDVSNRGEDPKPDNELWDWIEYRTDGQSYRREVAIRLTKAQEERVLLAESQLEPGQEATT